MLSQKILKVFIICIFINSCLQKKHNPYTDYNLKETLRYPIWTEPPTLDWNKSTDLGSSIIIQNMMEGLVGYDFSDGKVKIVGDLAKSWKSYENNAKWIFHVRKNVRWSDGKLLTAQDFVDSWQRLLDPKTASQYAYFLFAIKNARAYNSGKIKDFKKVGVKVGQSGEIIIHLEKSLSYFPYLFTHTSTFPIRKDVIQDKGSVWIEPENIVTLGPYKLNRWDHDKALILNANPDYYGKSPKIKKVILYIVPEETTILNLYLSGRLDVALNLPSRDLPFLKKRKDYKFYEVLSIYYFGFNVTKDIVKDPRLRRAIGHAINREEIVKLLNKNQKPLESWIPRGLFAHNANIGLKFNPEKAKALLKDIGYTDSSQLPKIQLFYNTTADHKTVAENIQAQLKKNINLDVELNNQEWKTYLQRLQAGDVQMFRLGWFADYPDPDNFMNLMTSFSENNHTKWKNLEFDKLVLEAMVTPNGPKRKQLYDKAQKLLLEKDVAVIPMFSSTRHILVSDRVKNFPTNIMSDINFNEIGLIDKQ